MRLRKVLQTLLILGVALWCQVNFPVCDPVPTDMVRHLGTDSWWSEDQSDDVKHPREVTTADPVWRAPLCLMTYSFYQTAHCSSSIPSDSCCILGLSLQPDKDSVWINYAVIILYTYCTVPVVARFSSPIQTSMGPTQPPVQWVPGFFSGGKAAGAGRWPPTPI